MAAEADGTEVSFDAREIIDDGMLIGRQRTQSSPAAHDTCTLEDRHTVDSFTGRFLGHIPIDAHLISLHFLHVARAHEDASTLGAAIESGCAIDHQRRRIYEVWKWLGDEDVAAPRIDRHRDAHHLSHAPGPGTSGVDD